MEGGSGEMHRGTKRGREEGGEREEGGGLSLQNVAPRVEQEMQEGDAARVGRSPRGGVVRLELSPVPSGVAHDVVSAAPKDAARMELSPQDALKVCRQSPLGPVDPSFGALAGRLKFTVRRHKFNKDSLP